MHDTQTDGSSAVERIRFDHPLTIAGRVTFTGQTRGSFPDGTGRLPLCSVIRLDKGGREVEIIGYAKVLRESLIFVRPQVADTLEIEYFGLRSTRSGSQFKAFKLVHNGAAASGRPAIEPANSDALAADGGPTRVPDADAERAADPWPDAQERGEDVPF